MQRVVLHVVDDRGVVSEYTRGFDVGIVRFEAFEVPASVSIAKKYRASSLPQDNSLVFTARRKAPSLVGVPAQSKSFLLVPYKFGLWGHDALREAAVLGSVEDEDTPINAHGGYDVGVLGLVSGLVDLSRVIYLLLDVHLNRSLFARRGISISTDFAAIFVVGARVRGDVLWDLDVRDLQVVLRAVGSVSAN